VITGPILDDQDPEATPFESHGEFQEDEGEYVITQECSWVPPINEDEILQENENFQEEDHRLTK